MLSSRDLLSVNLPTNVSFYWCGCYRKQKAMLKALETPEEKRARRLAKKDEKLLRQRKKEGWDNEYLVC